MYFELDPDGGISPLANNSKKFQVVWKRDAACRLKPYPGVVSNLATLHGGFTA